ncbi:MAG: hypothetical protein IJC80_05740 [Clostridia bacterium]|nr:hypothetical protein [Clostridia bacterium]
MVSGRERKIIHLKSTKSKRFDEAYLILKDGLINYDDAEILREAERIIFSAEELKRKRVKKGRGLIKSLFFLSLGFFLGTSCYLVSILIASI